MLSNLGGVAEGRGEYAKAATFYRESLDLYRELEEKRGIALLTGRLGGIARVQADHARAAALYDESLRLHRELGDRLGISQDLEGVAAMRAARGRPGSAARLWAAAEALREEIGAPPKDPEREVRAPRREGPRSARRGGLRQAMGRGTETHAGARPRRLISPTEPGALTRRDASYPNLKPCRSRRSGTCSMWNVRP